MNIVLFYRVVSYSWTYAAVEYALSPLGAQTIDLYEFMPGTFTGTYTVLQEARCVPALLLCQTCGACWYFIYHVRK